MSTPRGKTAAGGPAKPLRIGLDAYNLDRSKGSGIATYGRNLNSALRALGHETQLLHGPAAGLGNAGDGLNEIALHDPPRGVRSDVRSGGGGALARRLWRGWLSTHGRKAVPITSSGRIIAAPGAPAVDGHWAVQDLFGRAGLGFVVNRRFTSVTFPPSDAAPAPDVLHWTSPLPLAGRGAANLYTIHDLAPLRLPYATLDNKRAFHALCARICRQADQVVTVSETSKADIIREFGVDEGRITNTYQAVDVPAAWREQPEAEAAGDIEGLFDLGWRRYFLFFGALEPKKNLPRLIEAYLAANLADPLVIIGGESWLDEGETALLREGQGAAWRFSKGAWRRADRIRRHGFLPAPLLASLIRGAKAVVFPSLYEGFGLPVLEAMQLGTPVLSSTGGALPEVAGDAALLVDPFDAPAMKRALIALDADAGLRQGLAERGLRQAARFSPAAYQDRLGALYRGVL